MAHGTSRPVDTIAVMRRSLAVLALLLLVAPATALADGDPCSDILVFKSYCLPIAPKPSPQSQARIDGATTVADQGGYEIRVAIVSGPADLGAVPDFAGKPAEYAPFLAKELQFSYKGPLLIAMPNGYALANVTDQKVLGAVAALAKPTSADPTDVTNAAADAVVSLASTATGKTISIPPLPDLTPVDAPGGSSGSNTGVITVVVAGTVGVLVLCGGIFWWVRRAPTGDDADTA
jgi:hypothetical protein